MSVLGISLKDNPEQQELARLIQDRNIRIIFCEGPAGTGKDFCSIATALQMKIDKKIRNIYYTRDPVQVGKSVGFLKGDLEDKLEPFLIPLYDTIDAIVNVSSDKLNVHDLEEKVEVVPLFGMRGRSLGSAGAILIADEMQNCDLTTIQTLITRIGEWGKIILLGSNLQVDNYQMRKQPKTDFQRAYEALEGLPYVGVVHLQKSMRAEWTTEVDTILNNLKHNDEF